MILIQTAICPTCKKEFVPAPLCTLVYNGKTYCKPTCLMHRNDGKAKRDNKHKTLKKPTLLYKDGKLVGEYPSVKEAAKACGLGVETVRKSLRTGHPTRWGQIFKYKEKKQCEID